MLLDDEAGDAETAARLGHLMVHLVEGFPPITPRSACEAWIARVVEAEVRAHVLELELRRELGVTDPRRSFPFERDYYRAAPNRRAAVVRDYFVAHPEGGPGVPGFISIYRARCENVSPKRLTSPRTSR
jgi:hypothetical protein